MKTLMAVMLLLVFFSATVLAEEKDNSRFSLSFGVAANWDHVDRFGFSHAWFETSVGLRVAQNKSLIFTFEIDPNHFTFSDVGIVEKVGSRWSVGPEYRGYWSIEDSPASVYIGTRLFYGIEEDYEFFASSRANIESRIEKVGMELTLGFEYCIGGIFLGLHARPLRITHFLSQETFGSAEAQSEWAMVSTHQFATLILGFSF